MNKLQISLLPLFITVLSSQICAAQIIENQAVFYKRLRAEKPAQRIKMLDQVLSQLYRQDAKHRYFDWLLQMRTDECKANPSFCGKISTYPLSTCNLGFPEGKDRRGQLETWLKAEIDSFPADSYQLLSQQGVTCTKQVSESQINFVFGAAKKAFSSKAATDLVAKWLESQKRFDASTQASFLQRFNSLVDEASASKTVPVHHLIRLIEASAKLIVAPGSSLDPEFNKWLFKSASIYRQVGKDPGPLMNNFLPAFKGAGVRGEDLFFVYPYCDYLRQKGRVAECQTLLTSMKARLRPAFVLRETGYNQMEQGQFQAGIESLKQASAQLKDEEKSWVQLDLAECHVTAADLPTAQSYLVSFEKWAHSPADKVYGQLVKSRIQRAAGEFAAARSNLESISQAFSSLYRPDRLAAIVALDILLLDLESGQELGPEFTKNWQMWLKESANIESLDAEKIAAQILLGLSKKEDVTALVDQINKYKDTRAPLVRSVLKTVAVRQNKTAKPKS